MAIVTNIKNKMLYRYLGENRFRNIVTGVEGVVTDEAARNTFRINLPATEMCEQYPIVEELIKTLGLKIDKP